MEERFRIINPRNSCNSYMYDMVSDDIVIEICTGNRQMNHIMMEACLQLLHGTTEFTLNDLVECSEKHDKI